MSEKPLRNFLEIPYEELEALNLEAKEKAQKSVDSKKLQNHYIKYLENENKIKAVTVCFSDLQGRLHMLDYDKKFLLNSFDNLTFDGSSVRGFSEVQESDLRLDIDWSSFRWMPSDLFGPGKVIVFSFIKKADGSNHDSDLRGKLKNFLTEIKKDKGYVANVAAETEGFLFEGLNAEQNFSSKDGFKLVSTGGYYNSLPKDPLRQFIDTIAEAQRALGFENEKDHPEVAPSQFELNFKYSNPIIMADQIQLYKLISRQAASLVGKTASFLPKPITGINGSGMHCNISISKDEKNLFYDAKGEDGLSKLGFSFIEKILSSASDLCLVLNSSVNSYRRLDPAYEAPNQIKFSAVDRTSMVRIPLANEKSARIEVRTVAPDANPYMVFYTLLITGLEGPVEKQDSSETKRARTRFLPAKIQDAIRLFKASDFMTSILTADTKDKFISLKKEVAGRSPKELGDLVKTSEIIFHHEVTNQLLWTKF